MLWAIFVILLLLWLVGVVASYTMGGFIHFLLVVAVVVLIFQVTSAGETRRKLKSQKDSAKGTAPGSDAVPSTNFNQEV